MDSRLKPDYVGCRYLVLPAAQRMALCTSARYEGLPNAVGPWPNWIATTRKRSSGPIQARFVSLVGIVGCQEGPDLRRESSCSCTFRP